MVLRHEIPQPEPDWADRSSSVPGVTIRWARSTTGSRRA